MEITIDVLENFNKENNTKYTVEEWEKSKYLFIKIYFWILFSI